MSICFVSCSKDDKSSSCKPNGKAISTQVLVEKAPPLNANEQLVIPVDAKELSYSEGTEVTVNSSGKSIHISGNDVDDTDTDKSSTPTIVDFNQMHFSSEGATIDFSLDETMSNTAGKNVYRANSKQLLAATKKVTKLSEMNSTDIKVCSLDSAKLSFKYNDGDTNIETNIIMEFSVELGKQALEFIENGGSGRN